MPGNSCVCKPLFYKDSSKCVGVLHRGWYKLLYIEAIKICIVSSNDQQGQEGRKAESHEDNFEEPEKRVNDRIEGLP